MSSDRDKSLKNAIALSYDQDDAPTITARGVGELAEEIIALAQQHNIPLMENAYLLELLMSLDLGEEIPQELYLSVAEIIAFAYWLSGKVPKQEDDKAE